MPHALLTEEELEALVERAVRRALALLDSMDALSTDQAAAAARRTPKTVRRWIASGQLPASRRGRRLVVRRVDLDAFLAGQPEGTSAAFIVSSLKK